MEALCDGWLCPLWSILHASSRVEFSDMTSLKIKRHILRVLVLALILSGCGIPPLGYISVDPYSKPLQKKISTALDIFFGDDVKDSLIVAGAGMKQMEVSEFRKSCADALKNGFERNFETVNITDRIKEDGLVLAVYRIRPYWSRSGTSTLKVSNDQGGYDSRSTDYVSSAFEFDSSLYLNGKLIANADGKAFSERQMNYGGHAHWFFKDGFKITIESIVRITFTDEAVGKITGQNQ